MYKKTKTSLLNKMIELQPYEMLTEKELDLRTVNSFIFIKKYGHYNIELQGFGIYNVDKDSWHISIDFIENGILTNKTLKNIETSFDFNSLNTEVLSRVLKQELLKFKGV